jgi:uncharacterized protein YoxC
MTPLIQGCIVALTAGLIVLIVVAVLTMRRLYHTLDNIDRSLAPLEGLISDATKASAELRELLVSLDDVVDRVDGIVGDFKGVSERGARISGALLDEVEGPARKVTALVRGIKAAGSVLASRWGRNRLKSFSITEGGNGYA